MIKKKHWLFLAALVILAVFTFCYEQNRHFSVAGDGGTGEIWTAKEESKGMLLNSFSPGLSRGIYTLSLNYQNDTGKEVTVRLLDMEKNNGNNHLGKVISEEHLKTGEREDVFTFELLSDSNKVQLEFSSEVKVNSWKVDLEKDYYRDGVFLFLLLAVGGYVICYRGSWKKAQYAVFMIAAGIFITLPFAGEMVDYASGHDIAFHLSRIQGVAEGLRNGQIPVRLNMDMNQGYSFVSEMLYPNLFVYPPAILMVLGLSLMAAFKYWILMINVATALVGYYSFSRLLKSDKLGVVCSIIYLINPYRLNNIFLRASIGEAIAAIFLPLFLYGLYQLVYEEQGKWKALAAGTFGVLHSHVLTFQICILLGVIFCIASWRQFCSGAFIRKVAAGGKAVVSVIGLSLWFLVPFLDQFGNRYNLVNAKEPLPERTLYLFQMFMTNFKLTGGNVGSGMRGEMPLTIGPVLLLGSVCFLYYAYGIRKIEPRLKQLGGVCLALGTLSCYMASQFFPWKYLQDKNPVIYDFLSKIQFPWRMLGFASLFLSVVTVITISLLYKEKKQGFVYIGLGISVFMMLESMDSFLTERMGIACNRNNDFLKAIYVDYYRIDLGENDTWIFEEIGEVVTTESELAITEFEKSGVDMKFHFEKLVDEENINIRLPIYNYDLHKAYVNGEEVEIRTGEYGLIALNIPEGTAEGDVEVRYVGRNIYRAGDALTVIVIGGMLGYYWTKKKKYLKSR